MSKIFQHDVTSSYPPAELKDLAGVPVYAARVLASSFPDDVVILPIETKPHLPWILDHYKNIGLPCAQKILFGGYELLEQYPNHELSVSFFGDKAHAVRPDQKRHCGTKNQNSKNNFIRLCHSLQVATPKTVCFSSNQEYRYSCFIPTQFPLYVKKAVSASGKGVYKCKNIDAMNSVISSLDVPFQIQAALPEGTEFLNVQYEVKIGGDLVRGTISNQILKGAEHEGNYFPTRFDPEVIYQVTDILAEWARTIGLKEVFAFDVAVTPAGEVLPIECNPRSNGSTYYSSVADRLGVEAWMSCNVDFPRRTFDGLKLGELPFNKTRKEGIIIVNWGCVGEGKVGIFVAGSPQVRQYYLAEFKHRLK